MSATLRIALRASWRYPNTFRTWEAALSVLDLDRLRATPLQRDPFDYLIVDDFVKADRVPALLADYPPLDRHGSFPIDTVSHGPAFGELADELAGDGLREAIERKFDIDLAGRPTMITVRGWGDGKDGGIHTDSSTKIITLLLYMNPVWEEREGRLRLLRRADDLEDYAAEVNPIAGTMLAFRRSETSFHGHLPHVGRRCVIQLNWVLDQGVVRRELGRHRFSARLKRLNPFA